ncbi:MAG: hypothetical protein COX48_04775 [bacterium (Candidatus Stahlbacteria) CG23_combo_of_CG06-09_8_20_14_all_34_7]|nr:MAG: hypothetical protein COX48_04775 [bacterium (Candidatus Stahlbacteria) CG23_combo_of_CG06-09_8_20_14_all_34_7]
MNDYDSLVIESILLSEGYEKALSIDDASLVIVNGCSVRKHAEDRAMGFLSSVRKESRQEKKIVLAGCLARSVKNIPDFVDIAVPPTEYKNLLEILRNNRNSVEIKSEGDYTGISIKSGITLLISISKGCDNFCSYCIVPFLRGKEISFSSESIIEQIKKSVNENTREILLMGQNVNSYIYKGLDFTSLVSMVLSEFKGMRVRFVTSHPKDFSIKLIEIMSDNKYLCSHLHFPLQSGSDRMLSLMHRKYTLKEFKSLVELSRTILPDIAITTDVMVGLPKESKDDFNETLNALRDIRFDDAFMYKYSSRRFTLSRYIDSPSSDEGLSRLKELIDIQKKIKKEKITALKGKLLNVLVERKSKNRDTEYYGRDSGNRNVIVKGKSVEKGKTYNVRINEICGLTPTGEKTEEK